MRTPCSPGWAETPSLYTTKHKMGHRHLQHNGPKSPSPASACPDAEIFRKQLISVPYSLRPSCLLPQGRGCQGSVFPETFSQGFAGGWGCVTLHLACGARGRVRKEMPLTEIRIYPWRQRGALAGCNICRCSCRPLGLGRHH